MTHPKPSTSGPQPASVTASSKTPSIDRPLRVLLVAEAANPKLFSVSLIGWSFAQAIAQVAHAHLASEERNRADILEAGLGKLEFTAINNRFWQGLAWNVSRILRGGTTLGWSTYSAFAALAYPFFEREVWRVFGDRLRRGEFDVVHRVTPNSPAVPSLLAKRCAKIGVPFVLGPLNGGVPWPKEFPELRRAEREWLSPFRRLSRLMPGYTSTRAYAARILVGARSALDEMPVEYHAKCLLLSENAIDPIRFPRGKPPEPTVPLRVAFVGRLVPLKGVDMLLEAAAPLVRQNQLTLDIIGQGPDLPRLQQLAKDLGIANGVEFPGWVDHHQMAARLGRSQILGFPSLREFGGGVVLEAMALGLVPIVVNYGGPAELVPPGVGFALPLSPRATLIQSFQNALTELAARPERLRALGLQAQDHVYQNFTWEAKARKLLEVYHQAIAAQAHRAASSSPPSS